MQPQSTPLPPDVAYTLDTMLEHSEIDAGTHVAVKLYAPRVDLMRMIDGDEPLDGTRVRLHYRQRLCRDLAGMADDILAALPIEQRGVIAHAGIAHMRGEVQALAWHCANWAIEDEIVGGCLKPWKRPLSRHGRRYELSPKQARRLHGRSWIGRYVKTNDDARRLRGMGERLVARAAPIPREIVAEGADLLVEQLKAQHEGYRQTNARAIAAHFAREAGPRDRRSKQRHRATIKRAASTAVAIIGETIVSDFAAGRSIVLPGETLSLEIARLGSSASLGHGTLTISAVDRRTGRRLADLCVYHQNTPALDQLTALALGMQAGEEDEIIKGA